MIASGKDLIWHFRSLHYGYSSPTATLCLWWEVFPTNSLHVRSELRVQNLTIESIVKAINARTAQLGITQARYTVADEANIGKQDGDGETTPQTFAKNRMPLRVIKPNPIQGWTRIRELLGTRPDGGPWLTIHPSCVYLIKAMEQAMQDASDPADVMAFDNDQPLRALRVGAMSRPAPKVADRPKLPPKAIGHLVEELRSGGNRNTLEWK